MQSYLLHTNTIEVQLAVKSYDFTLTAFTGRKNTQENKHISLKIHPQVNIYTIITLFSKNHASQRHKYA